MGRAEAGACLALAAFLGLPGAVRADDVRLRYAFAPGQSWQAEQTVVRETRAAGVTERSTGRARFRYRVAAGDAPGTFRLDARMLSQQTDAGASPFDFSVIGFTASIDPRGRTRGVHFQLGDAEPPELPGVPRDPAAYRQTLRSIGEAWLDGVYWLPELPEASLAVGGSFVQGDRRQLGGAGPGVRMQLVERTRYTLRAIEGELARFAVEVRSTLDAESADSGLRSSLAARGEATFDTALGMWRHRELRSEQRADLEGAGDADSRASARTITTIRMEPAAE